MGDTGWNVDCLPKRFLSSNRTTRFAISLIVRGHNNCSMNNYKRTGAPCLTRTVESTLALSMACSRPCSPITTGRLIRLNGRPISCFGTRPNWTDCFRCSHATGCRSATALMCCVFWVESPQILLSPPAIAGDVRGDRRRRHEGVRVKHTNGSNSIKIYNKAGNVLRTETTINDTRAYQVYRQANDDPESPLKWQRLRKGTADMHRRSQISQNANERYLDALAACASDASVLETVQDITKRTTRNGRSVRALNPWGERDHHLFQFLAQGQWALSGFRNRDLAQWLNPEADSLPPEQRRKLASRASYIIRILRAHGLISKVPKSNQYRISKKATRITATVLLAASVQTKQLTEIAA